MGELSIRRLDRDDWELLRRLRLEALRDSPEAFGSTIERELAFDEATWRSRLETSSYFAAALDDEECGIACAFRPPPADDAAPARINLVSMWVAPAQRRLGVGARLVEKVLDLCRELGDAEVELWVVESNRQAIALYERSGFVATGAVGDVPNRPDPSCELQMICPLRSTI